MIEHSTDTARGQATDDTERLGEAARTLVHVLSVLVDATTLEQTAQRLVGWARRRESRYVCACNVHVVVTAETDGELRAAVNGADLATADGAPVAWVLRRAGFTGQRRISGPDLMWCLCRLAAQEGLRVFLFGSTPETLGRLSDNLRKAFSEIQIVGTHAPPFRDVTMEEDAAAVAEINSSGAQIVFVGLGCPKQELWMAAHRGKVNAVMLGVGAAFDFHAGVVRRAPSWVRRWGLEWFHRLVSEPKRLWKRYLVTNSIFLWRVGGELARGQLSK